MASESNLLKTLKTKFGEKLAEPAHFRNETTLLLKDPSEIVRLARCLKEDFHFEMLLDICGIDHLGTEPRFEIVYHVYSFKTREVLRFKTQVPEDKAFLPTVTGVWHAANWHEREVYDMLGIIFEGHPDLRRILMWEGYPYHPLRKDFPLAGKQSADTKPAPMDGGPFVTRPGKKISSKREPRAKGETFRKVE